MPAVFQLFGQAFERNAGTLGQRGFAEFSVRGIRDVARFFAVGDHDELIAPPAAGLRGR